MESKNFSRRDFIQKGALATIAATTTNDSNNHTNDNNNDNYCNSY